VSTIRIVFLGTPEFSVHALKCLREDNHFEVVGVVTQPDRPRGRKMQLTPSPVKKFANEHGLRIMTPENINDEKVLDELIELKAEAAVVVAFGQILSQKFLDIYPDHVVNVHTSLLPLWRGAAPVQRALMNNDSETGVSLQKVVLKLDAGDVLGCRRLSITDDLDGEILLRKMELLCKELLIVDFMDFMRGNLAGIKQDELLVSYAQKIKKSESEINWQEPARKIFNKVRALVIGPGTWTLFNGKKIKILKTKVHSASDKFKPGFITEVSKASITVGCGVGSLEILELQPESRLRMTAAEFLKGNALKKGEHFG